jgi:hypothetical protein
VIRRRVPSWIARVLIVVCVLLILYPGFHKSAQGFTTSCGPAVLLMFPGDPLSSSEAERASMDACLRQGAFLLLVGGGLIWVGTWLRVRHRRDTIRIPRRPDAE